MVTIAPMKFGGTSRLQLDSTFGATTTRTTTASSASSSSSSSSSSFRCKMHNGFAAVVLGRDVLSPQRAAVPKLAQHHQHSNPQHHHQRPPIGKERDPSSSRSPKSSNSGGGGYGSGVSSTGGGTFANAFDVEHRHRNGNVTNHLPISSLPGSPAQYRRLESRRQQHQHPPPSEESPKQQLPFNPGMTRKTAVTPRACRKAVVTEVRTDQARVVHQISANGVAKTRSNGLPKFHLNEQPSGAMSSADNKCRGINCKSSGTHGGRLVGSGGGSGGDKRETSQSRTTSLSSSHTISSLNKIVKSSMSSSNTSRDTSIESIVPKYKTIGQLSSAAFPRSAAALEAEEMLTLNGVSNAQKRSYNPQMLVRTSKFILNDEKVQVSRKTNVVIPRIRTSLNEKRTTAGEGSGCTTHNIPIYRDHLEEKVSAVSAANTNNINAFKALKENRPMNNNIFHNNITRGLLVGHRDDQRVPEKSVGQGRGGAYHRLYEDCDTDFFHRDPSNESLYIDFSKKRSPLMKANELSPLRPINKDVLLQRGANGITCDYTYQFEVIKKQHEQQQQIKSSRISSTAGCGNGGVGGGGKSVLPSVFYVSCASWMPKCNNKFSLRERRLLEESKTISRKR